MYGIHGQPLIELDSYLDIAGFEAVQEECTIGLALSRWDICSFGSGVYDKDLTRDLYAIETGVHRVPITGRPPHPDAAYLREVLAPMTVNQRRMYLKLRYGLYSSGHNVYLRYPTGNSYLEVDQPLLNRWSHNATHFPRLCNWIVKLPFEGVGRVLFFINEHNCEVVEHSDMRSSDVSRGYVADQPHLHEFIWIRPSTKDAKSLYVLDEATGARHYVRGNTAWFNSFDVHGADAGPTMTWSLRVDGRFTDHFRRQLAQAHEHSAVAA